jgi:hypothetical protein
MGEFPVLSFSDFCKIVIDDLKLELDEIPDSSER